MMRRRPTLSGLILLNLAILTIVADLLSRRATCQEPPSRAPFSLELPDLNQSGITSLEVRITTSRIRTVRLHIGQPVADKIDYNKIYTVVNAESANLIQTVASGTSGKIVTLDLESRPRFQLRPGKNVVEISATDTNKKEYYASFVLIADSSDATKIRNAPSAALSFSGRKFALVVGVSRYKFHEGGLNDLQYADADARSIVEFLKAHQGFEKDDITYLENDQATLESVRAGVELFLKRAGENDLVFLFLASHGAQDRFDPKNLYLILHDTKVSDMPRTALKMSDLQDLFNNRLRAKRMVIVIDACHSGGIGSGQTASARQLDRKENNTFGLYAEKLFTEEGRALLTSSDVNEVSEEGANWGGGHGIFTWTLLQGLHGAADVNHDRIITTGELFDFVSERVRQETNSRQNPRALPGTNRAFPFARVTK